MHKTRVEAVGAPLPEAGPACRCGRNIHCERFGATSHPRRIAEVGNESWMVVTQFRYARHILNCDCHPERSEGSSSHRCRMKKMLRGVYTERSRSAQHDSPRVKLRHY